MFLARLAISILAVAVLFWSVAACAATVAIVRPRNPPPLMTETLGRITGELASVGFATEIVDEPATDRAEAGQASRVWLEQLATRRGYDAVVAIVGDASPDSVEVWVIDKVTKKTVVRAVHLGPADQRTPKTLSVRAIELLRSSFLEIDLTPNVQPGEAAAAPPAVVRFVEMKRQLSRPERFGLELGGIAITSLDGVGPALLPLLRLDWSFDSTLGAQVTLAGLGTRPTVKNQDGSAQISQAFAIVGVRYSFVASRSLIPFWVLSAGILHTAADGRTDVPINQERQIDAWSFLLDGGFGIGLRLRDRLFLSSSLHAQVAEPRLAIRFVDQDVAKSAGPNLILDFAVGAWL